jgi:histidine phosphotransfer protein HptB
MTPFQLDKPQILERLGGDEEIFTVMVDMYLQDFENYCNNLDTMLQAGVQLPLQREVHTVKGLLATFADEPGTQVAYVLEAKIKGGEMNGLEAEIDALKARLHELAAVLRRETGLTG